MLPADRIVAVDSTQPGYAANHALDVEIPGSWLMPIGYGCLGTALPMAIGACWRPPTGRCSRSPATAASSSPSPSWPRRATSVSRCR